MATQSIHLAITAQHVRGQGCLEEGDLLWRVRLRGSAEKLEGASRPTCSCATWIFTRLMSVSCEKVAICTFLFSVQRSPPSHSSARFLWFQIEGPVSSVRKDIRQILCISRLLVVCCPLQGGRFPVQFAMAPFVCETKSENVTHEECAHSSYNSLSHDCDMRSESWRAGKSTTPGLGRSVSSTLTGNFNIIAVDHKNLLKNVGHGVFVPFSGRLLQGVRHGHHSFC